MIGGTKDFHRDVTSSDEKFDANFVIPPVAPFTNKD